MTDTTYLNIKSTKLHTYDAIVVGSGISGGWAAKELTEKGLKVLLIERGQRHDHIKDYKTASQDPWEFGHGGMTTQAQKSDYPVIHRGRAAQEAVMDAWVNEKDCPYSEIKPFTWWRSYRMGGRRVIWGRQSYRLSDLDFEANAKEGIAVDWPVRYADMAPWYDYVETFAGISGQNEGLMQLPDGKFLPPMEYNCLEKDVKKRIEEKLGIKMTMGRTAHLTEPKGNRGTCQTRNTQNPFI